MSPPLPTLNKSMNTILSRRRQAGTLRKLTLTPKGSIDFSSNDFLSLTNCPSLKAAFLTELSGSSSFKFGSGGSRLLDGNSDYAEELEEIISDFHSAPAALLFNSGFDANTGFFSCVPQDGDVVLFDEHVHASVREGMKLSRAKNCIAFKHNSVTDLKAKIERLVMDEGIQSGKKNVLVAIEALYSMDGDLAPVKEIVELVERLLPQGNGHVIVDEAHSNGIYGEKGRGIVCSLGLESRVFARLHTFGKGVACHGAAILCTTMTREYLINYARSLIYTTAMSFSSLAAIKTVYTLMLKGVTETRIAYLNQLIEYMYQQLLTLPCSKEHGRPASNLLQIPNRIPNSPIFALLSSDPRSLAKYCQDAGFLVRSIVPPTVPQGTQRIRVCLHAGNTFLDVERLVARIRTWLECMGTVEGVEDNNIEMIKSVL